MGMRWQGDMIDTAGNGSYVCSVSENYILCLFRSICEEITPSKSIFSKEMSLLLMLIS